MKKLLNTLYLTMPDAYLSLDGENVVVLREKETIGRVPLHNIDRIMTFGYAGVSPALMGKCVSDNIELVFMSTSGKFLARVEGCVNGNVLLRKQQYRISDDESKSMEIARNIIMGKIYNCRQVLLRTVRDHELRIDSDLFRKKAEYLNMSIQKCQNANDIDSLRGIEGEAASIYFSLFDDMLLQQKEDFKFGTRSKRPPMNNVNALLSFAYSLCTGMCASALEAVGMDPYVGFMHTDRPGRRSMALDLIEELRAWMCDRFVLMLINKKIINKNDFDYREDGAVLFNENGRKTFLAAWQNRKMETIKHPFLNENIEWGMIPYAQALLLTRYIRGDIDGYPVFMWK